MTLRGGPSIWYSTHALSDDEGLADLAWLGGTPYDEVEVEDGLEAPPRPTIRTVAPHTERPEEALPDLQELWETVPLAEREKEEKLVMFQEMASGSGNRLAELDWSA